MTLTLVAIEVIQIKMKNSDFQKHKSCAFHGAKLIGSSGIEFHVFYNQQRGFNFFSEKPHVCLKRTLYRDPFSAGH